jgi:hypothetical protein
MAGGRLDRVAVGSDPGASRSIVRALHAMFLCVELAALAVPPWRTGQWMI